MEVVNHKEVTRQTYLGDFTSFLEDKGVTGFQELRFLAISGEFVLPEGGRPVTFGDQFNSALFFSITLLSMIKRVSINYSERMSYTEHCVTHVIYRALYHTCHKQSTVLHMSYIEHCITHVIYRALYPTCHNIHYFLPKSMTHII